MANYSDDYGDYGYGEDKYGAYAPPPLPTQPQYQPTNSGTAPVAADASTTGADQKKKKPLPQEYFERFGTGVNYDLLISKTFYFFFFAAFGSLFPLIGVYFKQLGMNPAQSGMLIGFRPFVELVATPFWGNLADKWKKWKTILMFSLFCWILFTLSLAFVQPEAHSCLVHNGTDIFVAETFTIDKLPFKDMVERPTPPPSVEGSERRKRGTMPDSFEYVGVAARGTRGLINGRFLVPDFSLGKNRERRAIRKVIRKKITTQAPTTMTSINDNVDKQEFHVDVNVYPSDRDREAGNSGEGGRGGGGGTKEAEEKVKPAAAERTKPPKGKEEAETAAAKGSAHAAGAHAAAKTVVHQHSMLTGGGRKKLPSTPAVEDNDNDDDDGNSDDGSDDDDDDDDGEVPEPMRFYQFNKFPYPTIDKLGMSPLPINHRHIINLNASTAVNLVSPPMSAVVYRVQDIQSVFLVLLVLQVLGEFLSTPAITMADTATLGYLEDNVENYGRQRMYGSLGWALSMFIVGIALDHSNIFRKHPCGTEHLVDRNYMTCYAIFTVLMCCAFLVATQFRFKEVDSSTTIQLAELKGKVMDKVQKMTKGEDPFGLVSKFGGGAAANGDDPKIRISLDGQGQAAGDMISDVAGGGNDGGEIPAQPSPFIPRGQPGQAGTLPQWIAVLKMFAPIQYSSMLFILWYMGFGMGLVFAFLFWHLQDLHGSPTLFGISSVINHVSEIGAFFVIRGVVAKFGHLNVIYAGLIGNVIRFIYISYLENPWWVLPFELLQGLTHAGVWATGCSYMTQIIPLVNRPTAQMILQSLHHAVGRGCGTLIGGALINSYGSESVFRGYGITCVFVAAGFFALNFFYIRKLPPSQAPPATSNELTVETSYLAPHGVPGGGIPHSLSNSRLEKGNEAAYGSSGAPSTNGFLDSGGANYNQQQQYGADIYRGSGGGKQDYGYGYCIDPDQINSRPCPLAVNGRGTTGRQTAVTAADVHHSSGNSSGRSGDHTEDTNEQRAIKDRNQVRLSSSKKSPGQTPELFPKKSSNCRQQQQRAEQQTFNISYEDVSDGAWLY